ncbi:hypothetical protein OESDEN_17299 [Oesophagostomum dentatum]|uniref:Uncharacterized protein n=1 Tax=Oesophagostomum dentatum TaxID=61180 RepID=A0A0B1SGI7_OESDE|nr:hypothetical protein OESDEN_17299 [Oesophagostomum dentatum]
MLAKRSLTALLLIIFALIMSQTEASHRLRSNDKGGIISPEEVYCLLSAVQSALISYCAGHSLAHLQQYPI